MLTFLRKIRKSLFESLPTREGTVKQAGGSARKYLFYAIGEIGLVVIGILIALQINNWNQARIDRIEEQRLLALIHTELNNYLWLQERGSRRQENMLAAIERLLHAMKGTSELDSIQLDQDLHRIYSTRWIAGAGTATNVYDVLVNGGKLGILTSHELQKRLALLKEQFTYTRIYDQYQADFIDNQLSPFLNQYIDRLSISRGELNIDCTLYESPFSTSYDKLLTNREFSNLLAELIKHTRPIVRAYRRVNRELTIIDSIAVAGNPTLTPLITQNE